MANSDKSKRRKPPVPNESNKNVKPWPGPGSFIHLTSPKGGEKWSHFTFQTISWDSHDVFSNVDLILMKLNGEIGTIAENLPIGKGSFVWKVGDYLGPGIPPPCADSGGNYHIWIKTKDGKKSDHNNDPFTIVPRPTLVLTTPKGGTYRPENKINISWKAENFPPGTTVRLEIIEHISNVIDTFNNIPIEKGFYTWDISKTKNIEPYREYKIRIATNQNFFTSWNNEQEIEDESDGLLWILDHDLVTLTTMFEGGITYTKCDDFWVRYSVPEGPLSTNFFRDCDKGKTDPDVKNMMNDIVGYVTPPKDDNQIWNNIGAVYNWLRTSGHIVYTNDTTILGNISSDKKQWPSISDWAKYYKDHGKTLIWGTCASKISLFANLLLQLLIPQNKFAIACARHNIQVSDPLIATHFYIALYLNGRWFYLDPEATISANPPVIFPDFLHAYSLGYPLSTPNIDYQHPFTMEWPPECPYFFVPHLPP